MKKTTLTVFLILAVLVPATVGASSHIVERSGWSELGSFVSFLLGGLPDGLKNISANVGFAAKGLFAQKPDDMGVGTNSRSYVNTNPDRSIDEDLQEIEVPSYEGEPEHDVDDVFERINEFREERARRQAPEVDKPRGGPQAPSNTRTPDILEPIEDPTEAEDEDEEGEVETDSESEEKPEEEKISWCQSPNAPFPSMEIIINELAWMGSKDSPDEEWIELKNRRSRAISLEGYQLVSESGNIKVNFTKDDTIAKYGLFLLARDDEGGLQNSLVDKTFAGEIKDESEALYLVNDECGLVDKVRANPEWPAGNGDSKRTMIRTNERGWRNSLSTEGSPKDVNRALSQADRYSGGSDDEVVLPTILISEIQAAHPTDSNREFIEFYNPNSESVSLSGWNLVVNDGSNKTLVSDMQGTIPGNGFFLVASAEYNKNTTPDREYTEDNYIPHGSGAELRIEKDKNVVNKINYDPIDSGKSYERKALDEGVCVDPIGAGKDLGNECDETGTINDFVVRNNPEPQNSNSSVEP